MAQTAPKILLPNSQVLKGDNYATWKTKIQAILRFEDLWGIVSGTETHP